MHPSASSDDTSLHEADAAENQADASSAAGGQKRPAHAPLHIAPTPTDSRAEQEARKASPSQGEPRQDRSKPLQDKSGTPTAREPAARRPGRIGQFARATLKTLATLLALGVALVAALVIWDYYVTAPWTRDGRVRVQVASVAPQVSGQINDVRIVDNQYVHKGDVLYVIDPFDFQMSLDTARTQLKMKAADLQVKTVQAERRQHLSDLATTPEEQQQYVGSATQAQAAYEAAQVQVSQSEINLQRTQVHSPVNGFVTNLLMRVGDYAHEGTSNVSVIDADSYWVDGYFEETKLAQVCVGDRAEAQLMGYAQPIVGQVETVTRGISVSDAAPSTQGLPNVDPIYTWVRLAQRVPVRIRITEVPPAVPLISGMTATVTIGNRVVEPDDAQGTNRAYNRIKASVDHIMHRPQPRPDCVPAVGEHTGASPTLPPPETPPMPAPDQVNPGLTPGMTGSPRPAPSKTPQPTVVKPK